MAVFLAWTRAKGSGTSNEYQQGKNQVSSGKAYRSEAA